MNQSAASSSQVSELSGNTTGERIDEFIERFKTALSRCVQKGFHVEDCFGAIWDETLHEIELSNRTRAAVYHQLISWANQALRS